MSIEQEIR